MNRHLLFLALFNAAACSTDEGPAHGEYVAPSVAGVSNYEPTEPDRSGHQTGSGHQTVHESTRLKDAAPRLKKYKADNEQKVRAHFESGGLASETVDAFDKEAALAAHAKLMEELVELEKEFNDSKDVEKLQEIVIKVRDALKSQQHYKDKRMKKQVDELQDKMYKLLDIEDKVDDNSKAQNIKRWTLAKILVVMLTLAVLLGAAIYTYLGKRD